MIYKHDACPNCKFFRTIGNHDLWLCSTEIGTCYIIRHSSDAPDYLAHTDLQDNEFNALKQTDLGGEEWRRMIMFLRLMRGTMATILLEIAKPEVKNDSSNR